jgi:hypothetical protein
VRQLAELLVPKVAIDFAGLAGKIGTSCACGFRVSPETRTHEHGKYRSAEGYKR